MTYLELNQPVELVPRKKSFQRDEHSRRLKRLEQGRIGVRKRPIHK